MKDCSLNDEALDKIHSKNSIMDLVKKGISDSQIGQVLALVSKDTIVLNLDHNEITSAGAKVLSDNLHFFPKLKKLCLQFNNISKEGISALMQEKINHPELEILLHGNKVFFVDEMLKIEQEAAKSMSRLT